MIYGVRGLFLRSISMLLVMCWLAITWGCFGPDDDGSNPEQSGSGSGTETGPTKITYTPWIFHHWMDETALPAGATASPTAKVDSCISIVKRYVDPAYIGYDYEWGVEQHLNAMRNSIISRGGSIAIPDYSLPGQSGQYLVDNLLFEWNHMQRADSDSCLLRVPSAIMTEAYNSNTAFKAEYDASLLDEENLMSAIWDDGLITAFFDAVDAMTVYGDPVVFGGMIGCYPVLNADLDDDSRHAAVIVVPGPDEPSADTNKLAETDPGSRIILISSLKLIEPGLPSFDSDKAFVPSTVVNGAPWFWSSFHFCHEFFHVLERHTYERVSSEFYDRYVTNGTRPVIHEPLQGRPQNLPVTAADWLIFYRVESAHHRARALLLANDQYSFDTWQNQCMMDLTAMRLHFLADPYADYSTLSSFESTSLYQSRWACAECWKTMVSGTYR